LGINAAAVAARANGTCPTGPGHAPFFPSVLQHAEMLALDQQKLKSNVFTHFYG
jgi:hypothetical protein